MTRVNMTPSPRSGFDLRAAFRFLGAAPSYSDFEIAVGLLREAGIEVDYTDELCDLAEECGSSAFVALDLHTAVAYRVKSLYAGPSGAR